MSLVIVTNMARCQNSCLISHSLLSYTTFIIPLNDRWKYHMSTEAQIRANAKYNKLNTTQINLKFNVNTDDIIENLNRYKETGGSVRGLIIQLLSNTFQTIKKTVLSKMKPTILLTTLIFSFLFSKSFF